MYNQKRQQMLYSKTCELIGCEIGFELVNWAEYELDTQEHKIWIAWSKFKEEYKLDLIFTSEREEKSK